MRLRLLAASVLLSSCAAPSGPGPAKDFARLRIVTEEKVSTLDPLDFSPAMLQRTANVYESLISDDADLRLAPVLATSWGTVDPTTWEFRIRQGVHFHDGSLLDASDVVSSFSRLRAHASPETAVLFSTITSMDAVDAATLRVHTRAPDPLLLRRLRLLSILPTEPGPAPLPGTGPYRITAHDEGLLTLERNEEYWGPRPAAGRVEIRSIADRAQRSAALSSGEADILTAVPPDLIAHVPEGVSILTRPALAITDLAINPSRPGLQDPKARAAIARAIDRSAITAFAPGFIQPSEQLVPAAVFGFDPARKPKSAVTPSHEEIPLLTLRFDRALVKLAQQLRSQLHAAGIEVTLEPVDGSTLGDLLQKSEYDLLLFGWTFDTADPQEFLNVFGRSHGTLNARSAGSVALDLAIDRVATMTDPTKRRKALQDILQDLEAENVYLPLFESLNVLAIRGQYEFTPRLDGLVMAKDVTTSP